MSSVGAICISLSQNVQPLFVFRQLHTGNEVTEFYTESDQAFSKTVL